MTNIESKELAALRAEVEVLKVDLRSLTKLVAKVSKLNRQISEKLLVADRDSRVLYKLANFAFFHTMVTRNVIGRDLGYTAETFHESEKLNFELLQKDFEKLTEYCRAEVAREDEDEAEAETAGE